MKWLASFLFLALAATQALAGSHGTPWPNTGSPLGTNVLEIGSNNPSPGERPFLNLFKGSGGWTTAKVGTPDTGDETTLYAGCVDVNHYWNTSPCPGTTFTQLVVFFLVGQAATFPPQSGNYVLLWDGNATFASGAQFFGGGDTISLSSNCPITSFPNRIIVTDASAANGFALAQTAMGSPTPGTNFRLVYSPDSTCGSAGVREQRLASGEIFDKNFTDRMNFYSTIRMMKWMDTVNNNTFNWADRSLPGWAFWNENGRGLVDSGTPWEVQIALCNELNANCWFNLPYGATFDYMTQAATLVHSTLHNNLIAYEESGNEWWNIGAIQGQTTNSGLWAQLAVVGNAAYPLAGSDGGAVFSFSILQQVKAADLWAAVFSDNPSRLVRLVGGQFGFTGHNVSVLTALATDGGGVVCPGCSGNNWTGQSHTHFDKFTTAPYWPAQGGCPRAWTADADPVARCLAQITQGGQITNGSAATTTTHTTDALNACSVALGGVSANHYVATGVTLPNGTTVSSLVNGEAIAITLDTATISNCDDLNVNGLGALPLTNDQETIVTDLTGSGGGAAGISTTTLTIAAFGNITGCCSTFFIIKPGSSIAGSGVTAGTFVTAQTSGPTGNQGTYTVNNSQTKTCSPCLLSIPMGAGFSGGPSIGIYTSATSLGAQPGNWRLLCEGVGCNIGFNGNPTTGWINESLGEMASEIAQFAASPYNLGYVAYEGGQNFNSCCSAPDELGTMYVAMNRDYRMAQVMAQFFSGLRSSGLNDVFAHFQAISPAGFRGENWGVFETPLQTTTPKAQGTLDFIRRTPCWWANCRH